MVVVIAKIGSISNTITVTINNNATNMAINGNDLSISNRHSGRLTVTIWPLDHISTNDGTTPIWTSENTNILTIVSNTGDYTAVSNGETTVRVSLAGLTDQVNITVTKDPVTNVSIIQDDLIVTNGANGNLTVLVLPADHSEGSTNWSSSATNVISINSNNGEWRTVAPGQATITARVGNHFDQITITVVEPATSISINGGDFITNNGISSTLTATVQPANHTDGALVWTSSDTDKLTIDSNSGVYQTLAPGMIEVVAKVGSISNAIAITINNNATNIFINGDDFTIVNGTSNTNGILTATVMPAGHTNEVIWTSDDTNVITIVSTNGKYLAVGAGEARITVTAGPVANSIAIVYRPATNIVINGVVNGNLILTNNILNGRLTATVLPTNHADGAVVWTSSDTSKLTINASGDYNISGYWHLTYR